MEDDIITDTMVEDLLHRNKVTKNQLLKEINRCRDKIKKHNNYIEKLDEEREGLLEALEKVKRDMKRDD